MKIKRKHIWPVILVLGTAFWFCLPDPLFDRPYSTVILDKSGQLLGAKIAGDGQWRFPEMDTVPEKFVKCITTFEDERFYYHPGVDPIAIGRAILQNTKEGKVVSGASTLTMQTIRLSRIGKPRSFLQKGIEAIWALRSEIRFSKEEILSLYASHAPFGGNVVGLETAAWRYFRKSSGNLSWAESATLAVLPNAPALIYPGRNRKTLLDKRNRLLQKLFDKEFISKIDLELALLEPIPEKPYPLPQWTPHLTQDPINNEKIVKTGIDLDLQKKMTFLIRFHHQINQQREIQNAALLILDNQSGKPITYVGNTNDSSEQDVDMIKARRSSGSILKPLLYAVMMEEGKISPKQMLKDVPVNIDGFNPKNYNKLYYGGIHADNALARSLNVPAVNMLQEYGVDKFRRKLINLGFSSITYDADHYGLSLILGGAEVTLFDLCAVYRHMAVDLLQYDAQQLEQKFHTFSPGTIYSTFTAMNKLFRPDDNGNWETFSSSIPIAWKTGTSYGHRDAWAVGVTPRYTIGVWVGNADGEGRPEIIGSKAAGNIIFDVLYQLPDPGGWFDTPHDDLIEAAICKNSGHLAGRFCEDTSIDLIPVKSQYASPCPYHQPIFIDPNTGKRGNISCNSQVQKTSWFSLPADMAYFYKKYHADYRELPPISDACMQNDQQDKIALLYPSAHHTLMVTKGLNGESQGIVFKASHQNQAAEIHWHLDNEYLGKTAIFHEMKIITTPGIHIIQLIDTQGNTLRRTFEIVGEKEFTAL